MEEKLKNRDSTDAELGRLSLEDVKKHFGIERATAQRDMKYLKDAGLVTFKGAAKTGKYVLTEKALKLFRN